MHSPIPSEPWRALFGAGRARLGEGLRAAGAAAPTALRAAWLIEVERLPHEAERLLRREPLDEPGLRALLAAAAAQMYDDAAATAAHASVALHHHPDPLQPLHGWASLLLGQAQLELGWPERGLVPLQTTLRIAHRDGLPLLQLDALRVLARLHDERADADARDAVFAAAAPLMAAHAQLPAADSLRRLQAQVAARAALLGGPMPSLPEGDTLGARLARASLRWLRGEAGVHAEVLALRQLQEQQFWPLKWQLELGQLEGALAARAGSPLRRPVLPADRPAGLCALQAAVLDAGHARLAGLGGAEDALATTLAQQGLGRLAARLQLLQASDTPALADWWHAPGRDPIDALWLAPLLQPRWPALLAHPDRRRSAADQQALRSLGEQLLGPAPAPGRAASPPAELTAREWQVLQLIAQQWSNAQIADRLCVSEATVKTHINRVYAKLDLRDRQAAVLRARALGA